MNISFRILLILISCFLAYYIYNWYIAVRGGVPCVTLPWFLLLGGVLEVTGGSKIFFNIDNPQTKHDNS
jgi:hypothetical protein